MGKRGPQPGPPRVKVLVSVNKTTYEWLQSRCKPGETVAGYIGRNMDRNARAAERRTS